MNCAPLGYKECLVSQFSRLVQGAVFMTGEIPQAWAWPGGTCRAIFAHTILEDYYQAVVPGVGEWNCALVQEREVVFIIPASKMDELIQGFIESEKAGIFRYSTPFHLDIINESS